MSVINVYNYKTREEAIKLVSELDLKKVHHVKVTCKRAKRSVSANALYWMWLTCIEQETGNSKEDLHEAFKQMFLGTESILVLGSVLNVTCSSAKLDDSLFSQYMNKVQTFANSELGITLPNPDDLEFERFKDFYSKFI